MKLQVDSTLLAQIRDWRHTLHQNPELGMQEHFTAHFLANKLREFGFTVTQGVGGTGLVAALTCGKNSKSVALRAEMDALPLHERTKLEYASQNGCMHACGHDGHMAMLLGAAALLAETRGFCGTLYLVFQPAEETTIGAAGMLADGLLTRFPMDEIYGMHNAPFLPAGQFSTRPGGIMSSEDNFRILIKGTGCHASTPHQGVDPLLCFSEIYQALQMVVSRETNPVDSVVISCTEILADGARNAIPSSVEVKGDVRCFRKEDQRHVEQRMRDICQHICAMNGATCEVEYRHECGAVVNTAACVSAAQQAAEAAAGSGCVDVSCERWMASEDFSCYLEHVPGCLTLLGSGCVSQPLSPLHSTQFDFNDDVLSVGTLFWAELVCKQLPLTDACKANI